MFGRNKLVNLVVCLLFGAALVGQGLGYGKIYAFHLFLPIAFIALFISKKIKISNFKPIIPILLIAVYGGLSLMWTPHISDGFFEWILFLLGVGFLIVFINSNVENRKLLKVIELIVWINVFISLSETLQLFRYPYSVFSDFAQVFGKGHEFWSPHATDIPTGLHWNPNNNAFFFLLFSPLMLISGKTYKKALYYLVATYLVYMSASKLVLMGWILMSAALPFVLDFKLKFKIIFAALVTILAVSIVLFVSFNENRRATDYRRTIPGIVKYINFVPELFVKRLSGEEVVFDYSEKDFSLHESMVYLDGLAIKLKDHIFFGLGAGGLAHESNTQGGITKSLATPHFYFLEFLTKYGLFVFLLYFGWVCRLTWHSLRVNKPLGLSLFLFIILSPVISSASYFLPMWALFGFALVTMKTSQLSQVRHKQF